MKLNTSSMPLLAYSLTLSLFALATTACIRDTTPKLANVNSNLIIQGQVVTATGAPVANASILTDRDQQPRGTSDANGNFTLTFTSTDLTAISSQLNANQRAFRLYFRHADMNLYSASAGISLTDLGTENLGTITLAKPGTYIGQAFKADVGQLAGPAVGAEVHLGPETVKVQADGSFKFDTAPTGTVPFEVLAPGMQIFYEEIAISSGQTLKRTDNVILFPGQGPDGLVSEKANLPLPTLVANGHATAKHFHVDATKSTYYVRYHHDRKLLDALVAKDGDASGAAEGLPVPAAPANPGAALPGSSAADIPWHPVAKDLDYDFPDNGGQILYYQFADSAMTRRSKVYQVGVTVNVFADSDGFVINDGSGVSTSASVTIAIHKPAAAVAMHFAEELKDLATAPYHAIADKIPYNFHPLATDLGLGGTPIRRQILGQFRDAFGHESQVYTASVNLDLFGGATITVGDGSGTANSQVVPITTHLPPAVNLVKMAETQELLAKAVWQPAMPVLDYRFEPVEDLVTFFYYVGGNRQVCMQMEEPNGFVSNAICKQVYVDMFTGPSIGMTIEDGAKYATSKQVHLSIHAPTNATEMRIYENGPDTSAQNGGAVIYVPLTETTSRLAEKAWLATAPTAIYTFGTAGTKTLFLQFRDKGGLVSAEYQASITVLPLVEAYKNTAIIVDNGATDTSDSNLHVKILNIPASATDMLVSTDNPPVITQPTNWQPLSTDIIVPVSQKGPRTVFVLFQNSDHELSPTFQQTINYDPYPGSSMHMAINGGSGLALTPKIQVDVSTLTRTSALRYGLDKDTLSNAPFLAFTPSFFFTLPAVKKEYTLYVQFLSANNEISPIISQTVYLDPFPPHTVNMAITATNANTKLHVVLSSTPPDVLAGAYKMRYATSLAALSAATYQDYASTFDYDLGTAPTTTTTYTIYVQLKTIDGIESEPNSISNSITLP